MEKLTLLELHLEDASFTANAPGAGDDTADSDDEDAPAAGTGGHGRRLFALLALLVVLVAAARVLRGNRELDDLAALDEGA